MSLDTVKDRVESKYELEGRSVDADTGHVGQMTIAFCANLDMCTYDATC